MFHVTMRKTQSPFQPDGERCTDALHEAGECCKCGRTGDCKGVEVYAVLAYCVDKGHGTRLIWARYLGIFNALFCEQCLPPSLIEKQKEKIRADLKKWGFHTTCWFLAFVLTLIFATTHIILIVILGCVFLLSLWLISTLYRAFSNPRHIEYKACCESASEFVKDHSSELASMCEIGGLSWCNYFTGNRPLFATPEYITFIINPDRTGKVKEDDGKTKWMTESALDTGFYQSTGEGIMTKKLFREQT